MNSKQGSRYIKIEWVMNLKNKILAHNGVITEDIDKKKPSIQTCPKMPIR